MRICIVISDLGAGGAQRVIVTLVGEFLKAGHVASVVTFDQEANDFYALPVGTQRTAIGGIESTRSPARALVANARRVHALRRALLDQRPEAVLSFMDTTNVVTILATRLMRVPVIVSERTYPPRYTLRRPWELLRRITYRFADAIVMQTERGKEWACRIARAERTMAIANPLSPMFITAAFGALDERPRTIVAAGRLSREKGFDLLIDAFAESRARSLGWKLRIHGAGPEEHALREAVRERAVASQVTVSGVAVPLVDELAQAQVFVLPSRFEGFPNALLEAMASGCAVIASNCATGPSEIIHSGVNGILVEPESSSSIRDALDLVTADDALRARLGAMARNVREAFAPESIAAQWLEVLNRLRSKSHPRSRD